ncbi:MAG TPA: SRPBCC family protein [Gemmatimonadaceae bacterium]|nr:SRPBCC family protein [Gemmatimonadaceae bacterium]
MSGDPVREPFSLGPMPAAARMVTVDRRLVRAPLDAIFALARDVERWPDLLPHYRHVRFLTRATDGGGVVEMSAVRPFGALKWPTRWVSEMQVHGGGRDLPWIRYRHVRGVTRGMDVVWEFSPEPEGTMTTILHMWNGPAWPGIGGVAATAVIGPVFVHGIASRTLAGLAGAAERAAEASVRSGT